ncbi:MAG TPA: TldD/PmbA family protein [bacterium]|nr:TldD/PmbA family protein [bacterium]
MSQNHFDQIQKSLHSAKLEQFELFHERIESLHHEAKDGAIEASLVAVSEGLALRVFNEGKAAFACSTDLSPAGLERLVRSTVDTLPYLDAEPDQPPLVESVALPPVELKIDDPSLGSVPNSRKIQLALDLEAAARAVDAKIRHVRSASYDEKRSETRLRNSRGLDLSFRRSRCSLGVMAVAEQGEEAEGAYEFDSFPFFDRLDPQKVGAAAGRLALSYLGATTPSTRRVPVVLDPLVSGEILEVLAGSFPGEAVFKKRSFLEGKLGQRIYSPTLQVIDDSLLPEGAASSPFDGEGQPGRRLALIENGVVKNFLLDRLYARKLKLEPNASSVRRGVQRPPQIGYSNLFIPAGTLSDEAIFREVGAGILVTETFGMHAANPVTGDFSVGIQGFLIEGGEKRGPVKKLVLAGNLHAMMNAIRAVGSRHRFSGNVGAPTLALEAMAIGGS